MTKICTSTGFRIFELNIYIEIYERKMLFSFYEDIVRNKINQNMLING